MQILAPMLWLGPLAVVVVLVQIVVTRFASSRGWRGVFQLLTLVGGMLLMGAAVVWFLR